MDWDTLLTDFRIGREPEKQYERKPHRPPWQTDFDRITFSSAFRRLQDKTQVFPLSSSDYVRTRLTHSMEVSAVGKSLGSLVGFFIRDEKKALGNTHPLEVGQIVSAATLAHDIGNPPFGHSGENSIRGWFKNSKTVDEYRGQFSDNECSDFENYEGNAQGFRVLARLQMYRDSGGMQLTAATLAAFAKYPAQSPPANGKRKYDGASTKKFGFFQSDQDLFKLVANRTGLIAREAEPNCWCRHPLAFVVEAADDICYRIVDLEDGFRQKLISYKRVEELIASVLNDQSKMDRIAREDDEDTKVDIMRSIAIGCAIDEVAIAFDSNYAAIMAGTFDKPLLSDRSRLFHAFEAIKGEQKSTVYKNHRVLRVEATGFRVIAGLLEPFTRAVFDCVKFGENAPPESAKLFELIPTQFIGKDRKPHPNPYECILRIVDFICGMTDSYALELYRNISGISVP